MPNVLSTLNPSAWKTLGATIATAFGIQAAFAAVAIPLQTEKFYDLSGSLTFLSCTFVSLYYPALRARQPLPAIWTFHPRQIMMSAATVIWAGRLGSFLFQRIRKSGSDSRFDEIKKSPTQFAGAWFAQGVWVSLTALPVYAVNAIPTSAQPPLGRRDLLAAALWTGAFLFEVTADRQKSAWREKKEKKQHDEEFITSGLWSISRHPNYVGEVTLWFAQFLAANAALSHPYVSATSPLAMGAGGAIPRLLPYWMSVAVVASPVLEYSLIRYLSGVPMLEKSGDEKFKGNKKWEEYKRTVPVFWPKLW